MDKTYFSFNSNTQYATDGKYYATMGVYNIIERLTKPIISVMYKPFSSNFNKSINKSIVLGFKTEYINIFDKYKLPTTSTTKVFEDWNKNPMQFWQNQLNFAVWCATAGCGVSYVNHVNSKNIFFMKSLYTFHVYYTIRRILNDMEVHLPESDNWNPVDSKYNLKIYEKLCNEFNVSKNTDWKQKIEPENNSLGYIYANGTKADMNIGVFTPNNMRYAIKKPYYHWTFARTETKYHNYPAVIKQTDRVALAWNVFFLDSGNGFTKAGITRINESIRSYVWLILGSQAQARSSIINSKGDNLGGSFEAQKQFSLNFEDAINSPVNLPQSIERYQSVLTNAHSPVDYVFGIDLYMAPSNMILRMDTEIGYNNKIIIAQTNQAVGTIVKINTLSIDKSNLFDDFVKSSGDPNRELNNTNTNNLTKLKENKKLKENNDNFTPNMKKLLLLGGGSSIILFYLWYNERN